MVTSATPQKDQVIVSQNKVTKEKEKTQVLQGNPIQPTEPESVAPETN